MILYMVGVAHVAADSAVHCLAYYRFWLSSHEPWNKQCPTKFLLVIKGVGGTELGE